MSVPVSNSNNGDLSHLSSQRSGGQPGGPAPGQKAAQIAHAVPGMLTGAVFTPVRPPLDAAIAAVSEQAAKTGTQMAANLRAALPPGKSTVKGGGNLVANLAKKLLLKA